MIILYFQSGQNVGETVYSNPDSNYDNYCTVYQSLEKPTPGSTVYQSLEEQIPESSVYQSLNSDQEKPSGRSALKNKVPSSQLLPNPKSGFRRPLSLVFDIRLDKQLEANLIYGENN